jgi:hypothetical protein
MHPNKYRNQEDILEAVKPLLYKHGLHLTITDEIHQVGDLIYVQAEAVITDGENFVSTTAQAGIDPNRKGMDIAQSFGSSIFIRSQVCVKWFVFN